MKKQKITVLHEIISGRYTSPRNISNEEDDSNTIDREQRQSIGKIIKDKYRTFTNWNFRKSLPINPRKKSPLSKTSGLLSPNNSSMGLGISKIVSKSNKSEMPSQKAPQKNKKTIKNGMESKKVLSHKKTKSEQPKLPSTARRVVHEVGTEEKNQNVSVEQNAVKSDRRERFKKLRNPMHFLKHYMEKEHYSPTQEQKHLIERLIATQKLIQNVEHPGTSKESNKIKLDDILEKIYKLMNLAVDYNQLLFLSLIVLLAADICFYLNDYKRSFYYYNQARIAGTYAHLDKLKISALIGMAKILESMQLYTESKRVLKKCLQYCWRADNDDSELEIYDSYGRILHYQGKIRQSKFYHVRFAHNIVEKSNSALKKISQQILTDYDSYILSLQDQNLDSLFIEYLNVPINSGIDVKAKTERKFKNYGETGQSPRKMKEQHDFSMRSFLSVEKQLEYLFSEDFQFRIEIAEPDGCADPSAQTKRYYQNPQARGSPKKQLDFQHSIIFNRIIGKKHSKPNVEKVLKLSLQKQVEQKLKERLDPQWYELMVSDIKKKRMEKVGNLKERVRNSHLSYHKYPNERKKNSMWSNEKMNESFNRTLLDWIDPTA